MLNILLATPILRPRLSSGIPQVSLEWPGAHVINTTCHVVCAHLLTVLPPIIVFGRTTSLNITCWRRAGWRRKRCIFTRCISTGGRCTAFEWQRIGNSYKLPDLFLAASAEPMGNQSLNHYTVCLRCGHTGCFAFCCFILPAQHKQNIN